MRRLIQHTWIALAVLLAIEVGGFSQAGGRKFSKVRHSAVAGTFYPADPAELGQLLERLFAQVTLPDKKDSVAGIVVPHAGYQYSGLVAAHAYARVRNLPYQRVAVISPSHLISFQGSAVFNGDAYETPLGMIPIDTEFCRTLASLESRIKLSDLGHQVNPRGRSEHALEVQLPFLQKALGTFKLVPIVMGEQSYESCEALAKALAQMLSGDSAGSTLIVASSDLSHFHPYEDAVVRDQKVVDAIRRWDVQGLYHNFSTNRWEACGAGPIVATMMAINRLGSPVSEILKYANSGDVPGGDRKQVVGYLAATMSQTGSKGTLKLRKWDLGIEEQSELLRIAQQAVAEAVTGHYTEPPPPSSNKLLEEAAAFVTLTKKGMLRGCVGSIVATKPLYEAVADAARSAAIYDNRFRPIQEDELQELDYEISVLSPFQKVTDVTQIEVGEHGLLIERGSFRGLLLPQVATEHHWNRIQLLENTCLKAGLQKDKWSETGTEIYAFSATVFGETD